MQVTTSAKEMSEGSEVRKYNRLSEWDLKYLKRCQRFKAAIREREAEKRRLGPMGAGV